MKNNGSLGYLTREGMRNLYVNRLMSIASVSVLFSCMVMIGVAFMIMVNINMFIGNVEDQNVIMVFVDDSATKAEEDELGASLRGLSNVRECTFVGKDSGFAQLKDEMGDSSVLFDGLDENPLPDAYEVSLKDTDKFDDTVKRISELPHVLHIRENRQLAKQLAGLCECGHDSAAAHSFALHRLQHNKNNDGQPQARNKHHEERRRDKVVYPMAVHDRGHDARTYFRRARPACRLGHI